MTRQKKNPQELNNGLLSDRPRGGLSTGTCRLKVFKKKIKKA